jgi:hypothetical protein
VLRFAGFRLKGKVARSSSVVDNVPLVAAAQGMYSLATFPPDHHFWLFLAYCAGTGGSILIIGSAAGIAVMGIQQITFRWYVRHISFPALLGYAAGALTYRARRGTHLMPAGCCKVQGRARRSGRLRWHRACCFGCGCRMNATIR